MRELLISKDCLYEQRQTLLTCVELVYFVNHDYVMFRLNMLPFCECLRPVVSVRKSFGNALRQIFFIDALSANPRGFVAGFFLSHFLEETE